MSTMVTPIPRTTVTTAVFEQLISYVVKGHWKAGHQIPPERELCQQLGIARTSLREVLKAMELIGMLESRVGDGTFVCPRSEFLSRPLLWAFTGTDHMELRDIMQARGLLEQDLAELAAEHASRADIQRIGEAVELLKQTIAERQPPNQILLADMEFHAAIAQAAGNEVVGNAAMLLRNLLRQLILLKLQVPSVPTAVLECHTTIFEAIRSRNVVAARKAMREHLNESATLLNQIANNGLEQTKRRAQKSA